MAQIDAHDAKLQQLDCADTWIRGQQALSRVPEGVSVASKKSFQTSRLTAHVNAVQQLFQWNSVEFVKE
jgi:hypothetical protein